MAAKKKSNPYAGYAAEAAYAKADRGAKKRATAVAKAGRVASKQAQAESAVARKRAAAPAAPVKKAAPKKAAPKKYPAPAASGTTFTSTFGSKMEGPVSQRIRGAEWAYRKAGHAANLRKKARTKAGVAARKTIASDKKAGKSVGKYSAK
jgi:hypothetical protein